MGMVDMLKVVGVVACTATLGVASGCARSGQTETTAPRAQPTASEVPAMQAVPAIVHGPVAELVEQGHTARSDDDWDTARSRYLAALHEYQGLVTPSEADTTVAAEAQFWLAEHELRRLQTHRLSGTDERLKQQTEELFAALVEVVDAYESVAAFGDTRWSASALVQRGVAFEVVGDRVHDAPIPASLEADSAPWNAYVSIVEDMVSKLDRRALEYYQAAIATAEDADVDSEWIEAGRARAAALGPQLAAARLR